MLCRSLRFRVDALLLSLIVPSLAAAATVAFSDRTAESGLISASDPTYIIMTHCCFQLGGGAVGDFDNDGWQDLFHPVGGGAPDRLFINNGDGTFDERAQAWGVALAHRSTGAAVGDFDGDGWLDLYVPSLGPADHDQIGYHKLYRNLRGEGFVDVAEEMGVHQTSTTIADGFSAAWGDYDLDGDLDLAVAAFRIGNDGDTLFRNDGDRFTDVTAQAGIEGPLDGVYGYTPRFVDMDGDRYPELIWIGDFGSSVYLVNNGDGTFTDFTDGSGTSLGGTEMGTTVGDFDADGLFDFYVTTVNDNKLYINQGGNVFVDEAAGAGVVETGGAWATVAADIDHDTRLDLVIGAMMPRNYAFLNESRPGGPLSFREVALEIGLDTLISSRGLVNFDYDNDGDQDLVFFPNMGPIELHRNDLDGSDASWLKVSLGAGCSDAVPPRGVGSVVRARLGDRWLYGRIDGGSNYLSQSEMIAHFGLGAATAVDELEVAWTDGGVTTIDGLMTNQSVTITAADFCDYCVAEPNSTGATGDAEAVGSPIVSDNELELHATGLPPGSRAVALAAAERDFEPGFRGSDGNRCLARPGRVMSAPIPVDAAGEVVIPIELQGPHDIRAGETWHFQVWYDDGDTFNSTDGVSVAFR